MQRLLFQQDTRQTLHDTVPTLRQYKFRHGLFPILYPKAPAMGHCRQNARNTAFLGTEDGDSFRTGLHPQEVKELSYPAG